MGYSNNNITLFMAFFDIKVASTISSNGYLQSIPTSNVYAQDHIQERVTFWHSDLQRGYKSMHA